MSEHLRKMTKFNNYLTGLDDRLVMERQKKSHTLESLLLMVLIEMDSEDRFETVLKIDESLKHLELQLSEEQVIGFVTKMKKALRVFTQQGFVSFLVRAKNSGAEGLELNLQGERKTYVFKQQRVQMDIAC